MTAARQFRCSAPYFVGAESNNQPSSIDKAMEHPKMQTPLFTPHLEIPWPLTRGVSWGLS